MAGPWDNSLKRLVDEAREDFVQWLVRNARYVEEVSPHLKSRTIDADILYKVSLEGEQRLLHLEFQRRGETHMARRLLEYNVLATCEHKLPVYSVVLYLVKEGAVARSPYTIRWSKDVTIHHFPFGVIKLWEIPTHDLLHLGLPGLLPLLPLTREGKSRETIEAMIAGLAPTRETARPELLLRGYELATLIFAYDDDHDWLKRRFAELDDLIEQSWGYQELKQRAERQAIQEVTARVQKEVAAEERAKGKQEGQKTALHQTLLAFVHERFPALLPLAQEQIARVQTPEVLQMLLLHVTLAQDEQRARQHLLEATQ